MIAAETYAEETLLTLCVFSAFGGHCCREDELDEDGIPCGNRALYFIGANVNASYAQLMSEFYDQFPPLDSHNAYPPIRWSTVYAVNGDIQGAICPRCVDRRVRPYAYPDSDEEYAYVYPDSDEE